MAVDKILRGHDLFRSLSIDETHRITDFSSEKKYAAGETIFKYGDPGSHVYMLLDGAVDLQLPANPPEYSFVIAKIEKGELFGLSPLLDSERYTASALCKEDAFLLSIEAAPFRELLRANDLAGFNIMNQVAHIYFTRYIDVLKNLQGVVNQISMIG
jgi:CRP-like cAMP-binding protein